MNKEKTIIAAWTAMKALRDKYSPEINVAIKDKGEIRATECVGAIVEALEKQIPKKPIFVDTRFRNHGRNISDGVSIAKCYKCPNCTSHIFHVWDSEKCCVHCGQTLDWSDA